MKSKFTRRQFLKTSAAIGALTVVADKVTPGSGIFKAYAETATGPNETIVPTVCVACAAPNKCGLLAKTVKGVLVKVEGNPSDPSNKGRNCAKSNAAIATLYNPYRVKFPVKRTNPEKGPGVDPKWVQISWEEALNTVADKLKKLRKEDPRKFVFMTGHGSGLDPEADNPFMGAFGTPNVIYGGTAAACAGGSSPFNTWINGGGIARADMLYCRYYLSLGASSQLGAKGNAEEVDAFVKAKARGLKVVNVAPMISPSAAKADEWIPIIPGTTGAFLLAIINVILNELHIYDVNFVKNRTNGPYLIGEDGTYLRSADNVQEDPIRGDKLGKPLVWDTAEGKAKVFDDPSIKDVALEGSFSVEGKACRPALQLLKEHVQDYTPEKMAVITDISAATIRRLAKEWVENAQIGSTITIDGVSMPFRPVAIIAEQGVKCHVDNYQVLMATKILTMLVGAIDCPGSAKANSFPKMEANPVDGLNKSAITYTPIKKPVKISLQDINPNGGYPGLAYLTMKDTKAYGIPYDVEVFGFHGGNPQALLADRDAIDEAFRKIPFIFAVSLVFDEPTEFADIVLPESSWLERYGVANVSPVFYTDVFRQKGTSGVKLRQPVVKTLYDTKEGNQIMLELADKVGILTGEKGLLANLNKSLKIQLDVNGKYTWEQIMDLRLKASANGKGLEWFKQNGIFFKPAAPIKEYYGAVKFSKLRVPLYFEEFVVFGNKLKAELESKGITRKPSNEAVLSAYHALPVWRPHPEHTAAEEYDLYCINYKNMQYHYATDNAWAMDLTENQDPYSLNIWMNAATAAKKGLKDGDQVELESFTKGKVQGEIKTSQCIHPLVTAIAGCFGHRSANITPSARKGPNFNVLNKLAEEYMDPITWNIDRDTKVKIRRL